MKCENLPRARLKLWFLVWAAKSNLLKVKTIILNTTTQIGAYATDQIQKKFCPGTHKLRLWNCVVCCSLYSRFLQSVHFSRAFSKNWNVTLLRHLKHNGFQSCVKIHRLTDSLERVTLQWQAAGYPSQRKAAKDDIHSSHYVGQLKNYYVIMYVLPAPVGMNGTSAWGVSHLLTNVSWDRFHWGMLIMRQLLS